MKLKPIILLCFILFLNNCSEEKAAPAKISELQNNTEEQITQKQIEVLKYKDYVLSNRGEKAVKNWAKYNELSIQINYLKQADLSFFSGDKALIDTFINTLKAELPIALKTNPITSRIAVVETSVYRLYEHLTLDNISNQNKLSSIREMLESFSNLNYQINKKLERDVYENIKSQF